MTVKFIVTVNGQIFFGDCDFRSDMHYKVGERNGVRKSEIANGGVADLVARKVWGMSYDFGPYDREQLAVLLPGWEIAIPGDY